MLQIVKYFETNYPCSFFKASITFLTLANFCIRKLIKQRSYELLDNKIGRLLVVDSNDSTKLIGLLTKYDIIKAHTKLSSKR